MPIDDDVTRERGALPKGPEFGDGATLGSQETGPWQRPADVPGPETLGRFRLERMLGQGGMGQVWEAWDPQLERSVAVKRLLTADLAARRRFLREARLQATIQHPGVCPVFEVGQHDGEPYLVMPCLDGAPLDQALDGAALEYKLDILRQVAEAVHAAHQQGLIHRDLKPANILVEQPNDAPPRPVVLDFGIARPLDGDGLTASGELVGTPAYMAPEQVEGKISQLDRRTDVYALGATLYSLLTGRPPHGGEGTPLLISIMHEEPTRLPSSEVPSEVEAIVFKCLEKQKIARYDSAKALAEDLGRYLAGEPVQARPVTRWIRVGKWMRRHRVAVRVTAAASLMAVAGLAWGAWSTWRSEERQDAARRFGAQVEEIEALARYSHLVPLHDVREDQKQLRARLDAIRPSLDDRDPVVRALASHAMGRGHLALDELEPAREFLEAAYKLNPDNSEIAGDLGRTLSEIYRDQLTMLERVADPGGHDSLRKRLAERLQSTFGRAEEQQKQWQRSLGEPAYDLLTESHIDRNSSVNLNSLILFHENKHQLALDLLGDAPAAPSWTYERLRLEGDIRRSWGVNLAITGGSENDALDQLQRARDAYAAAIRIAQSNAALLLDDAQTIGLLVEMKLAPSADVPRLLDEARRILETARVIDPESLESWIWTARLESATAQFQLDQALDPTPALKLAREAVQEAMNLEHHSSVVWVESARIHEKFARWLRLRGEDPSEALGLAAGALDQVALEDRDYFYYIQMGILQRGLAAFQAEQGIDPTPAYQAAAVSYRSAAEIHSEPFAGLVNLGSALFEAAGVDETSPKDLLEQAVGILEQARDMRPDHMVPHYYLGLVRGRLAQEGNLSRVIVADDLADLAEDDFEKAIELSPESFQPWIGLGEFLHLRAIAARSRDEDPTPFFTSARRAHERALELAPDQPTALLNFAWAVYFQGKFALRDEIDATTYLTEAKSLCLRSIKIRRWAKSLLCLGSVLRLQAENQLNHGNIVTTSPLILEAEEIFREILDIDPGYAEAYRSLGRLKTLESEYLRRAGGDPSSVLVQARQFLDQALALESSLADFHLADALWHLENSRRLLAGGQPATESVAAGHKALAQAVGLGADPTENSRLRANLKKFQ